MFNQGIAGIWIGYNVRHPFGTYRILNPKTNKISLTRNVTFLNKSYRDGAKIEKPAFVHDR